ncbi:MAG: Lrp/AsnC family transcriptional regulator [Pseudomonadota bacterium]
MSEFDVTKLDAADRRILRALQVDARRSIADLAEIAGLSASACHRRIKLLEERGLVSAYVARLDRARLGFALVFFVEASLVSQGAKNQTAFEAAVAKVDEILECHLMAGETDYFMRVVATDLADFERIHRDKLAKLPHLGRLKSNLTIREVRPLRGLPVR